MVYGLALGLLFNLLLPLLLPGDKAYLGDDHVSLWMVYLFGFTCVIIFILHTYKHNPNKINLPQLLVLAICFSIGTAISLGFGHFINASFIDPNWSAKSLELLQQK